MVGRDPEVGISFDDNDRDNVEDVEDEKSGIGPRDYIGPVVENREELGDDSDYGGSGDHESQVRFTFLILNLPSHKFNFQDDCRSIQIHPDQVGFYCGNKIEANNLKLRLSGSSDGKD